MSSSLESQIDLLYQQPPGDFVASRTALAKTLTGADAARVKRLEKPTTAAWAVNQVYWHSRGVYDRLARAGEKLRSAQIATLKGKAGDVRGAADDHQRAISEAVAEASRHLAAAKLHPDADALARTFEALSVASEPAWHPGRLIKPLQPAGFEALAGIAVKAVPPPHKRAAQPRPRHEATQPPKTDKKAKAEAEREERELVKARAAIEKAEEAVAHAKTLEARAREEWLRSKAGLSEAEEALAALRTAVNDT